MKMTGVEYVVDYMLQRIGDLEKVYLVGNMSKGKATQIIDLVLVGDNLNKTFLIEQIEKELEESEKKANQIYQKYLLDGKIMECIDKDGYEFIPPEKIKQHITNYR